MVRERISNLHRFAVYYGRGSLQDLAEYDMVILEPAHYQEEEIQYLKSRQTLVMAYASVIEVPEYHPLYPLLREDDFLRKKGEKIVQPVYGGFYADLASPHWQTLLHRHIGQLLVHAHYDGVFLDTIGNVEWPELPDKTNQLNAAMQIVASLRKWFPQHGILQNNGLETLVNHTAPFLDAIIWENVPLGDSASAAWIEIVNQRLRNLQQKYAVRTLLLFDRLEQMTRQEILRRRQFADLNQYPVYFAETYFQGKVTPVNRHI
ncbi:endo alpha-1,4 polygalactosaminidase [Alicyclobacillus tolerans]|uniref:Glycoside-hydrolase family GH114 n=1 Tax=Alicyclobacillus tolerans TaxID=90970 RepID=A0A1M6VTT2_9BACL|nr:endo alpha-1,4 polygalactosaminidase [Alicyclobacillus montanus]SHK84755.1 Glycoside-hydrolase family GH114 [Alicyclobacillus montanus]